MDPILYHVSDDPNIARFDPRPTKPRAGPPQGEFVWALDDAHLHTYLLPRDCPRVVFFPMVDSQPEDVARFMGAATAPRVLAIDQPLAHLVARDVELRVMPSLWELREAVVGSTLAFSITRMRKAAPPPPGFVTQYPL